MIQIKNACDANWKEMTPADSGKYCGACEKVVVDFSKMNDIQIKEYFTEYTTQKTCVRFLHSQLDRTLVVASVTPFNTFLNRLNQIPVTRTILLFLTSTSMWISSCVKNNNDDMTTGESIVTEEPIDTTEGYNVTSMGLATPIVKQLDSLLIKQDLDTYEMGEIAPQQTIKVIPPAMLMGDIAVSPNEPNTVYVTIPATCPAKNDDVLQLITGKVKMVDTISQKIKRKK